MNAAQALLQSIRDNPGDDTPRLVYADWLEENNDPNRGELIRVQVELAGRVGEPRRRELRTRERQLLDEHGAAWLGPLAEAAEGWRFERGFVASVTTSAGSFLKHATELFASHPVRELKLTQVGRRLKSVVELPELARLTALDLSKNDTGDVGARALAASPHLANLTQLSVGQNNIGLKGARALAGSPYLTGLTELNVGSNRIEGEGVLAILESPNLQKLHSLNIYHTFFGTDEALAFARSLHAQRLTSLEIGYNGFDPEFEPDQFREFITSARFQNLRRLELSAWGLRNKGAELLASAPHLAGLIYLDVSENLIDSRGAAAIVQSPYFARLEQLDLSTNNCGDPAVVALAQSPHMARLTELELTMGGVGDTGAKCIAQSGHLKRLRILKLAHGLIGDEGALALANSPHLNEIEQLDLRGNDIRPISPAVQAALRNRFGDRVSL